MKFLHYVTICLNVVVVVVVRGGGLCSVMCSQNICFVLRSNAYIENFLWC